MSKKSLRLIRLGNAAGFFEDGVQEWLASRPESVRRLIVEFPPMTEIELDGVVHYVIGATEGDELLLSRIDPEDDYDGACESAVPLCAKHLREAVCDSN